MTDPDDIVELFLSLIVLLVGAILMTQLWFDVDITPIVNLIIELAIPVFMIVFVAAILSNIIADITN